MNRNNNILRGIGFLLLILFVFSSSSSLSQIISSKESFKSSGISKKENSFSKSDFQVPVEEKEEKKEESESHQKRADKNSHKHSDLIRSFVCCGLSGNLHSERFSYQPTCCGNLRGVPYYLAKRYLLI